MEPLLLAPVDDPSAFRSALHGYFLRSAHYFYRNRDLFHLVMREAWRLQFSAVEESWGYLHTQVERGVTALSGVVERAVAAGVLRSLPARSFAHIILSSVANYVAAQEVAGWPDDPNMGAEEAAALLTTLLMDEAMASN